MEEIFKSFFLDQDEEDQLLLVELIQYLIKNPSSFIDMNKLLRKKCLSQKKILHLFEILENKKIGKRVFSFTHKNFSIELLGHFKFYFFELDTFFKGHESFLRNDQGGAFLEQYFFSKIYSSTLEIFHFRTQDSEAIEVDFILKTHTNFFVGIEIKKDQFIYAGDLKGLHFFDQHFPQKKELFVLHSGIRDTKEGIIHVLPMNKGIEVISKMDKK